ncbi:MAG TPA: glutathione S-transferase family protein [Rubrivivax sp.]|nr:glutathione S-transferase family protein [Rubrivivax sp.]
MPDELILHHYEGSPFAEKARLMLGYKGLTWKSVHIPVIMPKPDLTALTGGYRRTPVLQVGADIYCDTALLARVLEARAPSPTLFPKAAPMATVLAQWADFTLFWSVIPYTMQPAGLAEVFKGLPPDAIKAFAADRAPFAASLRRQTVVDATAALHSYLDLLEAQLADGRPYLFGEAPCIADFSVAHNGWYVRRGGGLAKILESRPALNAWLDRMLAIGHGRSERLRSQDAIEIAAATEPLPATVQPGLGFEAGQPVTVTPMDYGLDPVAGMLVGLDRDTVAVARTDTRAGLVHVHFPRRGYQIKKEQT